MVSGNFRDPDVLPPTLLQQPRRRFSAFRYCPGILHDMIASHYHGLRIGVRSASARAKKLRRSSRAWLSRWAPSLDLTTTYARIQFGHERFTVIREKDAQQSNIVSAVLTGTALVMGSAALVSMLKF